MARYRLLDPPHKGIRHLLGQWSLASGNTDPRVPGEWDRFTTLTALVVTMLEDHGRNEEEWVFPLLDARIPQGSHALHADHEQLDTLLAGVNRAIQALDTSASADEMHAVHLLVSEFHARYLLHMIQEETTLEPALWDLYSDEELMAAEAAVAQSVDPQLLLEWFRACAPARTVREDVEVLRNVRVVLPPEAFAAVLDVVASALPEDRFSQILAALAGDTTHEGEGRARGGDLSDEALESVGGGGDYTDPAGPPQSVVEEEILARLKHNLGS